MEFSLAPKKSKKTMFFASNNFWPCVETEIVSMEMLLTSSYHLLRKEVFGFRHLGRLEFWNPTH